MEMDDLTPGWPQRLRWSPLLGAVLTGVMTCIMPIAAVKSAIHDESAMVWVASAMAVFSAFATVGLSGIAGFRYLKLSQRIVACQDDVGSGIAIPNRKHLVPILVALGATASAGLVVAAGWFLGSDIGPLAARDRGQALYLTACGFVALVAFLMLLGFRSSKEIRLYPSGIRRIVTLNRLWSTRTVDTFVSWDDIVEFEDDEMVVGGTIEVRNPIIWLVSGTEIPGSSRLRFDDPNRLRLDAYLSVAEPNTLLGLLSALRESADRRNALTCAGGRALLTPPPLRSRLWPATSAPVSAGGSAAS